MSPETASPDPDGKTIGVLLSTMRSGSTLLKALLAQAPDISDLPETDFQRYVAPAQRTELEGLSDERILLLKRPGWFNDIGRYPRLPDHPNVRAIALVRDTYAFGLSARKMAFRHVPFLQRSGLGNRFLVERYWRGVNQRLLDLSRENEVPTLLVRYEDVLTDPIGQTAAMFKFLGSSQTAGVETYSRPQGYSWRWGKDDGGAVIKSLKVQPQRPIDYADRKLFAAIKSSEPTLKLRRALGYPDLP
ncbi:sulfotransferase [Opitutaceae bacterium]|nr:sulfotransferase [Opitutaceae bacterium]